jgi:hypothetical protein
MCDYLGRDSIKITVRVDKGHQRGISAVDVAAAGRLVTYAIDQCSSHSIT